MNFAWSLLVLAVASECGPPCPDLCSCPSLSEMTCSSLTRFPALTPNTTRLSIRSAAIATVTALHLDAAPHLTHLQLYYANLSVLPSDLLRSLPQLETLDLTGNLLSRLPPNIFGHAPSQNLVLRNNRMEKADADWFSTNGSVTSLDLSGNRLVSVPAALLRKLPHLRMLDLSDNHLQVLPPDWLASLSLLTMLNLAGNKLTSLEPAAFSQNLKLRQIFLQENRLEDVPVPLLQGLTELEMLLLNQNRLQRLPSGFLDRLGSGVRVVLSGNPWVCDGRLEPLRKFLRENPHTVLFKEDVTCSQPPGLEHREVRTLTQEQLTHGTGE